MTKGMQVVFVGRDDLAALVAELDGEVRRVDVADEAIGACAEVAADIVIVDLDSEGGGVDALRRLRGKIEDAPLLGISKLNDPLVIPEALASGAAGVVGRAALKEELKGAVQILLAGGSYLGKVDARTMVDRLATTPAKTVSVITDREREVLGALAEGMSARQIATKLDLSERTVNTHISNIYRKLRVNNRVEAVRAAMKLSLVPSDG